MSSRGIGKYVHAILEEARRAAQEDGSGTIEAEHLLLAIAHEHEPSTEHALTSVGLDGKAIREMLDREFDHTLSTVGVSRRGFDLQATSAVRVEPRIGASAKLALERGLGSVAHKRDLRPAHLLLGVLQARVGTVPRALELAGIDQADLTARVEETLAGGSKR